MKYVWNIVEREGMERPFWNRIGVAFENSDGSLNVRLDCLPMNGKLHNGMNGAAHMSDEQEE